ncbi:hypothetical protein GEV33_003752 [Tenebrio molitor]|uniref:Uncharacterized protein n=1 Tax=Tenebrio molitor TaxID=7067 RepID=A0A8J6LE02_TENMO|nr:hypothetical protein GEV33_003752 [Tenebrio molitor]
MMADAEAGRERVVNRTSESDKRVLIADTYRVVAPKGGSRGLHRVAAMSLPARTNVTPLEGPFSRTRCEHPRQMEIKVRRLRAAAVPLRRDRARQREQ